MSSTTAEILERLKGMANPDNVAGMARFGINPNHTYGVPVPVLRAIARETGRDHALALALWESGIHEARLLASMIADPRQVDEALMERWVQDFDSWDICDQTCSNLFDRSPFAYDKAVEWTGQPEEFVRRAGFVMMAALAVHDKKAADDRFEPFFPLIVAYSTDGRNFVKKAVNWALRGIGKRNRALNRRAIEVAQQIQASEDRTARWIAAGALRELTSEKTIKRIK